MEGRVEKSSRLSFKFKPGTFPRRWLKPTEAEINIYPESKYGNNIIPVKAVDWDRRIITVAHSGQHWQSDNYLDTGETPKTEKELFKKSLIKFLSY